MNSTDNETTTLPTHQLCNVELTDMLPLAVTQLLSLVANAVAAIAIWRLPRLERNKNHLVVRTLIVSDLLIPIPMLPTSIASYSNCGWIGGKTACIITAFLSTTLLSWSVFIVFVLCILRYLAVKWPLWYRNHVTYTRVKIALLVAFLWASLHLMLPTAGVGQFRLYKKGFYCALDLTPQQPRDTVLVYLVIVEGVLSAAALFYSCAVIIISLVKRKRRVSQHLSPINHRRGSAVQLVKRFHEEFATLTVVIVVLFCVCYGPFLLYRFFTLVLGPFSDDSYYYTELIAHLNPLLNPVVYVICNKQYRSSFKHLLTKCCEHNRCTRCCVESYPSDTDGTNFELRKIGVYVIGKQNEGMSSHIRRSAIE